MVRGLAKMKKKNRWGRGESYWRVYCADVAKLLLFTYSNSFFPAAWLAAAKHSIDEAIVRGFFSLIVATQPPLTSVLCTSTAFYMKKGEE